MTSNSIYTKGASIIQWLNSKEVFPRKVVEAYLLYKEETKADVSLKHFSRIFTPLTKIQVIKTGGVYANHQKVAECLAQRARQGVSHILSKKSHNSFIKSHIIILNSCIIIIK